MNEQMLETLYAVIRDLEGIREEVRFGMISEECVDTLGSDIMRLNDVARYVGSNIG